jgi:hypothetical protein
MHSLCMAIATALVVLTGHASYVVAQEGLPGSSLHVRVVDDGSGELTYYYRVTNGAGNMPIWMWKMDISRSPASAALPCEGRMLARRNGTSKSFESEAALVLDDALDSVVPVGCVGPQAWSCGLRNPRSLNFSGREPGLVQAGEAREGFIVTSEGLPAIRDALLEPRLVFFTEGESATEEDAERARAQYLAAVRSVRTIAPAAPPQPFDAAAFLDSLRGQALEAEQLGWIRGPVESESILSHIERIDAALLEGSVGRARSLTESLMGAVDENSCAGFECPPSVPFLAEARALLGVNLRYLRDQLPANSPPVSDAGEDRVVACTNAEATAVLLDAACSSDPDGNPLVYSWSGAWTAGESRR